MTGDALKEEILKEMSIGMFAALADETPDPSVAEVDAQYNAVEGETVDGETAEGEINRQQFGKARRYVSHPSEVPEGYEVHEGPQGGYYYETEDTSEGQGRLGPHDPDETLPEAQEEEGEGEAEEEPNLPEGRAIPDEELRDNGIEDDLWYAVENGTVEDVESALAAYDGRHIKSEGDYHYYTALDEDGEPTVVEWEEDFVATTPAHEWVSRLDNDAIEDFLDYDMAEEYNEDFWRAEDEVGHATRPESAAKILLSGELQRRNQTRGLGNQSVGRAVFTSRNTTFDAYGEVVFNVDVDAMREDGFTPMVTQEPEVEQAEEREAVAREIGLDDFYAEIPPDISHDTAVFHDDIPTEYLTVTAPDSKIEEIKAQIEQEVAEGNATEEQAQEALEWLDERYTVKGQILGNLADGLHKARRYVNSPEEVPEGYEVEQGPQGGLYYETEGTSEGQSRLGPHEGGGQDETGRRPDETDTITEPINASPLPLDPRIDPEPVDVDLHDYDLPYGGAGKELVMEQLESEYSEETLDIVGDVLFDWDSFGYTDEGVAIMWDAVSEAVGAPVPEEVEPMVQRFRSMGEVEIDGEVISPEDPHAVIDAFQDYMAVCRETAKENFGETVTVHRGFTKDTWENYVQENDDGSYTVNPQALESWTRNEEFTMQSQMHKSVSMEVPTDNVAFLSEIALEAHARQFQEVTLSNHGEYTINPEDVRDAMKADDATPRLPAEDLNWLREVVDDGEEKSVFKSRIYVDSPEEVPEGFEVQEGAQGGIYYETDEGDQEFTQEEWEQAGLEILEDFDEDDYRWDYWEDAMGKDPEPGAIVHIHDDMWAAPGDTEGPRGVVVDADPESGQYAVVTENGDMVMAEGQEALLGGEAEIGLTAVWDSPDQDNIRTGWDDSQRREQREEERREQIRTGERAPSWATEDPLENITDSPVPEGGLEAGELYLVDGDVIELERNEEYEGDVPVYEGEHINYSAIDGVLCRAGNPQDVFGGEVQYFDFSDESELSDGWYHVADDMEQLDEDDPNSLAYTMWNGEEGMTTLRAAEVLDQVQSVHRPRENSYNMDPLEAAPEPAGSPDPNDWTIEWGTTEESGDRLPMAQKKLLMREWKAAVDTEAAESVSQTIRAVKDNTYNTQGQKYDKLIQAVMGVEGEPRSGDFEDAEEPTDEEIEAMRVLQTASQKFFAEHYGSATDVHRGLADYSHENLLNAISERISQGESLSGQTIQLRDNPAGVWTTQESAANTFTIVGGTAKSLRVSERVTKEEVFNMPDAIYPYEQREEVGSGDSDWDEGEVNVPSHGKELNADEVMVLNMMDDETPGAPLSQVVDDPQGVFEEGNGAVIARFVKTLNELAPEEFYESYVSELRSNEDITGHEDWEKVEEQIKAIEYDPNESIFAQSMTQKQDDAPPIILDVKDEAESDWLNTTDQYMQGQAEKEYLTGKARRYVNSPDDVPEGFEVQEGPQGGLYYETEEGDSDDEPPESEGGSDDGDGGEEEEADGGDGGFFSEAQEQFVEREPDVYALVSELNNNFGPKVVNGFLQNASRVLSYIDPEAVNQAVALFLSEDGVPDADVGLKKELEAKIVAAYLTKHTTVKGRRYVESPDDVPEGYEPQQGPQGGVYYETGEGGDESEQTDGHSPEAGEWEPVTEDMGYGDFAGKEILVGDETYTASTYMPGDDYVTVQEDLTGDEPGYIDAGFEGIKPDAIDGVRDAPESDSDPDTPTEEESAEDDVDLSEWEDPPGSLSELEEGQTVLIDTGSGLEPATVNWAHDDIASTFLDDLGEPHDILDVDDVAGVRGEGYTDRPTPEEAESPDEILEAIPFMRDAEDVETRVKDAVRENVSNVKDEEAAKRILDHIEQFESMPGRAHVDFAAGSDVNERAAMNVGSAARDRTINHEFGHMVMDAHGFGIGGFAAREAMMQYDSSEDNFIQLDPEDDDYHLVYREDGDPDPAFARLAGAVNEGWKRLQEGGEGNADDYNIKNNYSATNAHEFLAALHETLQKDRYPSSNNINWFDNHPELLPAYTEIFEPSDANKELISYLHEDRGDGSPFDENPYPDHYPEDADKMRKQNNEVLEIRDYYRVWVKSPDQIPDEQPVLYDRSGDVDGNHYYYEVPFGTTSRVELGDNTDIDVELKKAMSGKATKEYPERIDLVDLGVPEKDLTLVDKAATQIEQGIPLFGTDLRKSNPSILQNVGSPLTLLHLYKMAYDEGGGYEAFLGQLQQELGRRGVYSFEKVSKGRRYVESPDEAPAGAQVQEGQQGGLYYETGTGETDETGGSERDISAVEAEIQASTGAEHVDLSAFDDARAEPIQNAFVQAGVRGWTERVDVIVDHVPESFDDDPEVRNAAEDAFGFFSDDERLLYLNPDAVSDEELADAEEAWFLTDGTIEGLVNHEIGHARHRELLDGDPIPTWEEVSEATGVDVETLETVAFNRPESEGGEPGGVSRLAQRNPAEFVAEAHAALAAGQDLDADAMDLFKFLIDLDVEPTDRVERMGKQDTTDEPLPEWIASEVALHDRLNEADGANRDN